MRKSNVSNVFVVLNRKKAHSFLNFQIDFGTHNIEIKKKITPFVTPVQRIPHDLKPKVENELKRMVDLDVMEPADELTDWINDLVIVEKPNEKL